MTARILVVNDTQEILELFRIFLEEERISQSSCKILERSCQIGKDTFVMI